MFIYGLGYIYRDMFRELLVQKGITSEKVAPILILIGIVLQISILFAFLQTKAGKSPQFNIVNVIDWMIANFPFRGQAGHIKAFIVGCMMAVISIFTLERSKMRY